MRNTLGRRIAFIGAAVAVALVIGASSAGCSSSKNDSGGTSSGTPTAVGTEADSLKASAAGSSGATAAMKTAVADHVTKVGGAHGTVNIYTDLTGSLGSSDGDTAKLVVSAATDRAAQEHKPVTAGAGLITVYNESGAILSNGDY
ncbi:hypothetical protein [Kitasatospora phosalacinea]|uniref:hypothetical protein n=1 Tax=Kitasatospora phosalacinea TaxID=2065 RepID=UPI0012FEBE12|nr:hypothetical protein [Kitasatospora phosalacinea]